MKYLKIALVWMLVFLLYGCGRVYILDLRYSDHNTVHVYVHAEVPKNINANADIDPNLIPIP